MSYCTYCDWLIGKESTETTLFLDILHHCSTLCSIFPPSNRYLCFGGLWTLLERFHSRDDLGQCHSNAGAFGSFQDRQRAPWSAWSAAQTHGKVLGISRLWRPLFGDFFRFWFCTGVVAIDPIFFRLWYIPAAGFPPTIAISKKWVKGSMKGTTHTRISPQRWEYLWQLQGVFFCQNPSKTSGFRLSKKASNYSWLMIIREN